MYSPPLTSPFVQIAHMERHVSTVTTELKRIITMPQPIPTTPAIQLVRKNKIVPKMLKMHLI